METEEAAEEKQEHLIQLIVFGIFLELTQGGFELLRSSSATATRRPSGSFPRRGQGGGCNAAGMTANEDKELDDEDKAVATETPADDTIFDYKMGPAPS